MSSAIPTTPGKPRVLIIGGGFAGLECARGLAAAPVEVTLADRHNYHLFQPLLYQVATAVLSPADIAAPIRRLLRNQGNAQVVLAELVGVDLPQRLARLQRGDVAYDYLVLATGATHSYFGHDDWAASAPGLKTVDDALEVRRRVLLAYEAAEWEADALARQAKLTFVVIGGGPTGVELAGALKEIAAQTIPRDFRHIDTTTAQVILVEAGPRLLAAMPEKLGLRARRDLEQMGVQVRLNSRVTRVEAGGVWIGGDELPAENIIWAAGVRGSEVAASLGCERDPQGRVLVEPDLSVPGHREVFVIGDLAHLTDPRTGRLVPGVAPAALQMGRHVAELIRRELNGRDRDAPRPPFRYRDKGSLATIGRNRAVAAVGGRQFGGFIAWLLWGVVHIIPLIGFRNKLSVILSWLWSYVSLSKNARLITGRPQMKVKQVLGVVAQNERTETAARRAPDDTSQADR
jgi:NADH dehydrogenase